jgi:hypothetical protein
MLMRFMCEFFFVGFFSRLAPRVRVFDFFSICCFQTVIQGVTRVDDPIASIDLCLEAVVGAGMGLVLVKSTHV